MFYTYESYLEKPKALTMEQMQRIHRQITEEVRTDEDALDLYEDVLRAANRYAGIRSDWLLQSREQRMDADEGRTGAHNSFIRRLDILARYLEGTGSKAAWRDELGDLEDDPMNRKPIGDFACYLAFVGAINMR